MTQQTTLDVGSQERSKSGRVKRDAYFTPDPLALTLVRTLARDFQLQPDTVLEPSAGGGAFVRAIRRQWPAAFVTANDIQETNIPESDVDTCFDFVKLGTAGQDLIVGNPPFKHAEPHVRHALSLRKPGGTVAFLLRLAFAESKGRVPFWEEFRPARVYVLSERPSFTGGGTDSAAYGFFVWQEGWSGPTEMNWIHSWKGAV